MIKRMMRTKENRGGKKRTTRIVREAFELVESRTDEHPVQVLVRAIEHAAPREETVRLKYGGISVPQAVDVAPQRRVDQALKFIAEGTQKSAYKSPQSAGEALASVLMGAADNDVQSHAVAQKEERERVAAAAR